MNIKIVGKELKATEAIKEYIEKKAGMTIFRRRT